MTTPIPLSNSNVRIFSGVRFSRDYSHVRWFQNISQQDAFFNNLTPIASYEKATFIKHNHNTGIFMCPLKLTSLLSANYMSFENNNKTFYCFIDNIEYKNEGTTEIYFTIDIMQTFMFNFTVKESLVEREHVRRYSNGIPNRYTLPENLNYGESYETRSIERIAPYEGIQFLVIVCKQPFHTNAAQEITPIQSGLTQGLTYYIHPFIAGHVPQVSVGGSQSLLSELDLLLRTLYNQGNAVNNVVAMYVTDNTGLQVTFDSGSQTVGFTSNQVERVNFHYDNEIGATLYVKSASSYTEVIVNLGDKYSGLQMPVESKLLMYPYTVYVLTDLKGMQLEVRPEWINGNNLEIACWGSLGTSNKVSYSVRNYKESTLLNIYNKFNSYNEGLISQSPATIPVLSDYLAAYLQGNVNSIQNKMNSIAVNGIFDGVSGAMSIASNTVKGRAGGAGDSLLSTGRNFSNSLLDFQAVQAQLKDISNVPPNLSSQGDNTNFDYGHDITGLFLIKKQIKPEYRNIISDYFTMYGYKVNILKDPNLFTRTSYNYVKLATPNIIGDMPLDILHEIKNIFKEGVTLWHVNDMNNYYLLNNERN